jgi:hypothetical protein
MSEGNHTAIYNTILSECCRHMLCKFKILTWASAMRTRHHHWHNGELKHMENFFITWTTAAGQCNFLSSTTWWFIFSLTHQQSLAQDWHRWSLSVHSWLIVFNHIHQWFHCLCGCWNGISANLVLIQYLCVRTPFLKQFQSSFEQTWLAVCVAQLPFGQRPHELLDIRDEPSCCSAKGFIFYSWGGQHPIIVQSTRVASLNTGVFCQSKTNFKAPHSDPVHFAYNNMFHNHLCIWIETQWRMTIHLSF